MQVKTINLYQSDPRSLSDEELKTLSAELEEAYTCSGHEEACWLDNAAEERYWQLQREERRRWVERYPEEAARFGGRATEITREALKALKRNLVITKSVNREFDRPFSGRVGDTVWVQRKPFRFGVTNGPIEK